MNTHIIKDEGEIIVDPICKMAVDQHSAVSIEHDGRTIYFCSKGCRDIFAKGGRLKDRCAIFDLIVIGGGPAGMTASVYAAILQIDAFIITSDLGGQAVDSTKIKNYMGYDFITGPELSRKFREQLIRSNYIDHLMDDVESITKIKDGFTVTVAGGGTFSARTIIIATGMYRRKLCIPGEEEFQRKGIFYGNIQDLSFVHNKDVVVIGGGNSAMQITENLAEVARNVHVVSNLPLRAKADAVDVEKLIKKENIYIYEEFKVIAIEGKEIPERLIIQNSTGEKSTLNVSGVFIAIGMQPNSAIAADLVELNERGEIIIAPDCSTSKEGLFASGDVTNAYGKRIIIAASEGAKAAIAVRQYLLGRKKTKIL